MGFGAVYEHFLPSGFICFQSLSTPSHTQVKPAVRHLMNDKETFVIEYLKEHQFVDVLDQEFMSAFANRFNCKARNMGIGAPRVPLAGKTLSAMFKNGLLTRSISGLDSYAGGVGFPKWVYTYALKMPNTACTRLETGAANADSESNPAVSSG